MNEVFAHKIIVCAGYSNNFLFTYKLQKNILHSFFISGILHHYLYLLLCWWYLSNIESLLLKFLKIIPIGCNRNWQTLDVQTKKLICINAKDTKPDTNTTIIIYLVTVAYWYSKFILLLSKDTNWFTNPHVYHRL